VSWTVPGARLARRSVPMWAAIAVGCSGETPVTHPPPPPVGPGRPFEMGFAPNAPRPDMQLFFDAVDSMSAVSEVTILQQPVPWPELLAGASFDSLVEDRGGVADHLRAHGLDILFLVDPLDGLDRRAEDPGLVAAGRSILEPEIRQIHEDWVRAIASRVRPEWFGLASEINTLAARGDPALYAEIRDLINTLAPQVRARAPGTRVFVSFQVDEANGEFGLPPFDHYGLVDEFDVDAFGLSSYPVFVFDAPDDIPDDYFDALRAATPLPLIFVEGGWSSASTPATDGTPEEQADWVRRYADLLERIDARLFISLTFTDLDIGSLGLPPDRAASLSNFAHMGIVDTELHRKPAYAAWQSTFERGH